MVAMRVATYADIEALPEGITGEIINGELYTQPRPANRHAMAGSILGADLITRFGKRDGDTPSGWILLHEVELHLEANVLVPDISGWRRERLPKMPRTQGITVPPNWLCEVLSPGTARKDRAKKLPLYHKYGVDHVWLVDPDPQTVEIYRRTDEAWTLVATYEGEAKVKAEPFESFELDLAGLWAT
jgi:Uma2 family endonuclease